MRKLLLLLFSFLFSLGAYGESLCYATFNTTSDNITVILSDDSPDLDYDELLTVCEEGDILTMSGFDGFYSNSVGKYRMSHIMASYCDLKETQVIDNSILVCKLVDRDLN